MQFIFKIIQRIFVCFQIFFLLFKLKTNCSPFHPHYIFINVHVIYITKKSLSLPLCVVLYARMIRSLYIQAHLFVK